MKAPGIGILALLLCLSFARTAAAVDCYSGNGSNFSAIDKCLKDEQARAEEEMQRALSGQQKIAAAYDAVAAGQTGHLAESQSAFLQYRQAECGYQSKNLDARKLSPETAERQAGEIRLSCLIGLTQQRAEWLRTQNGE